MQVEASPSSTSLSSSLTLYIISTMALRCWQCTRSPFPMSVIVAVIVASMTVTLPAQSQQVIERDNMIIAPSPAAESVCTFDALDYDTHFYLRYEDVYPERDRADEWPMRQEFESAQFEATYQDDCDGETWPQEAIDSFERA